MKIELNNEELMEFLSKAVLAQFPQYDVESISIGGYTNNWRLSIELEKRKPQAAMPPPSSVQGPNSPPDDDIPY